MPTISIDQELGQKMMRKAIAYVADLFQDKVVTNASGVKTLIVTFKNFK